MYIYTHYCTDCFPILYIYIYLSYTYIDTKMIFALPAWSVRSKFLARWVGQSCLPTCWTPMVFLGRNSLKNPMVDQHVHDEHGKTWRYIGNYLGVFNFWANPYPAGSDWVWNIYMFLNICEIQRSLIITLLSSTSYISLATWVLVHVGSISYNLNEEHSCAISLQISVTCYHAHCGKPNSSRLPKLIFGEPNATWEGMFFFLQVIFQASLVSL